VLSVNIVCQDEAQTLPYTLYCIEQVLKPYLSEVVLVDGGSVDDTINIIEEWRRRLPIVFLYHVFDAPGKQKNRGLERCTGKWVLGVDADMTFTRNLGDLLALGHFDSHEVWDFLMYYTVIDEYHAFEPSRGTTTRLWQNKFRFERDFHESITSESKKACKGVWMFEEQPFANAQGIVEPWREMATICRTTESCWTGAWWSCPLCDGGAMGADKWDTVAGPCGSIGRS